MVWLKKTSHFSVSFVQCLLIFLILVGVNFTLYSHSSSFSNSSSSNSNNSDSSFPDLNFNFSSYFGGSNLDESYSVAVDSSGNSYIAGYTSSNDFPIKNSYNSSFKYTPYYPDAFLAKFNPTGKLLFSTLFGGTNQDYATDIALDNSDNIYITGYTGSSDFPTKNAYNSTLGGNLDAFIAKFDSTGNLLFSTLIGGNDFDVAKAIAINSLGNIFITGNTLSSNFPVLNALDSVKNSNLDCFISQFNSSGGLISSTYFGGNDYDQVNSLAIDSSNNLLITGQTDSTDFPGHGSLNISSGIPDVFVSKFNPTGNLVFTSFLKGNVSQNGYGIATDILGNFFVTGTTRSSDFSLLHAYDTKLTSIDNSGFVAKFNSSGSLLFSTYTNSSFNSAIAVDTMANCYIVGLNGFFEQLSSSGGLLYNSNITGSNGRDIVINDKNYIFITGTTMSTDFPTKNAFNSTYGGISDGFISKFSFVSTDNQTGTQTDLSSTSSLINNSSSSSSSTTNTPGFTLFSLIIIMIIPLLKRKFIRDKK